MPNTKFLKLKKVLYVIMERYLHTTTILILFRVMMLNKFKLQWLHTELIQEFLRLVFTPPPQHHLCYESSGTCYFMYIQNVVD